MGRFGSPYAALSFTDVDPALAVFDPHATPLEQFVELVDSIHQRNAKIFIDIAINHTGWAASLHESHPQWLVRSPEGKIEVPGAWGVSWEDLTKLDYENKDLWQFIADVFIKWCHRGVDGFRCDAGYMIPLAAWKYIVAKVKDQYPDTVFLLEGLGGKISVTRDLLNMANLNWTYSELFQNYDRGQVENYLPEANDISNTDGITVHFAETHDNPRIAAQTHAYAKMRTALSALFSHQGAFGFANGVEWFATEKINVHDAPSLNWGADTNQVEHIKRLNYLLKTHPAFQEKTELKMVQQEGGNHIVLLRHHIPSDKKLLVVVNLDDKNQTLASWNPDRTGLKKLKFTDLLTESPVNVSVLNGMFTCLLEPGQVLCLSQDIGDPEQIRQSSVTPSSLPQRIELQRFRAKAMEVLRFFNGTQDLGDFELNHAVQLLAKDPVEYCRNLNPHSHESRVINWYWPRDIKREVMVPPGHFLLVRADTHFRARIIDTSQCLSYEESLPCSDGSFFALFAPLTPPKTHRSYILKLSIYTSGKPQHVDGPLLFLSPAEEARVKRLFYRPDLIDNPLLLLGTNDRGGMLRAHASWGELASRYDALLAANMNPELPEDRWIMFARCRAWLVFQGYSQEICNDCFFSFYFDYRDGGTWRFQVPTGQGEHVFLNLRVAMAAEQNCLRMVFSRELAEGKNGLLTDNDQVRLILRPDVESRNFHETTKAYQGPEHTWQKAVKKDASSFTFAPDEEHKLKLVISEGSFVWEPEWHYMIHRPIEAERGLDPDSDLFSPGYFSTFLKGGQSVELTARITARKNQNDIEPRPLLQKMRPVAFENNRSWRLDEALNHAVDHYVVKRGSLHSVIAGYPWFLDWGRDALIFVRGLIAAGKTEKARSILTQFGQFEKNGTLPNMIRGKDAGNRDTSDAPLWFFIACADLVSKEGNDSFLDTPCGDQAVRHILLSIARFYMDGTPNGIHMDKESGLIFSPAHFTWMDTNDPAGTPRQGYPIEIQALWYAALSFLSLVDPLENSGDWKHRALQVKTSIADLFLLENAGYLSDCLHAVSGVPAGQAEPDDALRPNQLIAVTLNAVSEKNVCRQIVEACEELLVPGAIRSLADRPVRMPLEISHHGKTINNPHHPYQGKYAGDEDTKRKPAYHNGTAWTWLFPSFCEAWVKAYGKKGEKTALSWLASSTRHINQGCIGHVPEVLDGDFPHKQRGCDAQAWGVSELLRVWITKKD
jgi:predicted glycogen debranching enzyme